MPMQDNFWNLKILNIVHLRYRPLRKQPCMFKLNCLKGPQEEKGGNTHQLNGTIEKGEGNGKTGDLVRLPQFHLLLRRQAYTQTKMVPGFSLV